MVPHVEAARGAEELVRSLRYVALGFTASRPATFRPAAGGDFAAGFRDWVRGPFRAAHGPHFARVAGAASHEGTREVAALDRAYDEAAFDGPGDPSRLASLALGRDLAGALDGARHVRFSGRVARAVERGDLAGHFATLLACHSATLHVPVRHGLVALAFFEWRFAGGVARVRPGADPDEGFAFDAEDASLERMVSQVVEEEAGGADGPALFACA